uniref:ATPase family AAA domain-containing protein 1-B n=1 Tax=Aceria tosichella TaxID=561515 RepID=A0A6G1SKM8_9ACAR
MDDINSLNRTQLLLLLARLVGFGAFSYYALKYVALAVDPTRHQKKEAQKRAQQIFDKLKITNSNLRLNEYELVVASQLIDPDSVEITWSDIGGLDNVISDIKSEVILPMRVPYIIKDSRNHRPPTGVLLHGPPGCGKTMLAKATAREAGARFINLEAAMLTDKWYGETQKLAKAVFTLAKKIQPCIIFIDEIDSFLRSRDTHDHEATAMVKALFMTLWDGLETDSDCQIIVMGATNRPRDVDRAILRRMPAMYLINLPDASKRRDILAHMIDPDSVASDVRLERLAELTEDFSGSDLREMYRAADMIRVKEFVNENPELFDSRVAPTRTTTMQQLRKITMADFTSVINKMIESRGLLGMVYVE